MDKISDTQNVDLKQTYDKMKEQLNRDMQKKIELGK